MNSYTMKYQEIRERVAKEYEVSEDDIVIKDSAEEMFAWIEEESDIESIGEFFIPSNYNASGKTFAEVYIDLHENVVIFEDKYVFMYD